MKLHYLRVLAGLRGRLLSLLLLALPVGLKAQFTFTTNVDGTLNLAKYTGPDGPVTIPSTTNGQKVTSIGFAAFGGNGVTSVVIPDSINSIGQSAFSNCQNLTNVTVPDSVTNIGMMAFYYSTNLSSVELGNGLINIDMQAFFRCTGLASVTLGNSVISIGIYAFASCPSLTGITIPNKVISLGSKAFSDCTSLTSVTIPSSVTSIGISPSPFTGCTSLTAITVDPLNSAYSSQDGVLFNSNKTALIQYPGGKGGSYAIPNGVTSIAGYAFQSCLGITNVTIPSGVTNIGSYAFTVCSSLLAITVDPLNSAYSSQDGVLFNSNKTAVIQCPGGKSGSYAILNSVTRIGVEGFQGCANLATVTIPGGVTNIGDFAFSSSGLTSLYFKGNPPSVGVSPFAFTQNLTVYYLSGTVGWSNRWQSLPTLLWNPQFQTADPTFGVQNNQFGFTITGTTNIPIVLEASANLASPSWTSLQTCTLTNGSIYFSDQAWTNYSSRFYRIRSP